MIVPPKYSSTGHSRLAISVIWHLKCFCNALKRNFIWDSSFNVLIFFFLYLNHDHDRKHTLTLNAVMRIENGPMVRVKLCTNNYKSYSYYFPKFRNNRDTCINFRVVVSKLMSRTRSTISAKRFGPGFLLRTPCDWRRNIFVPLGQERI